MRFKLSILCLLVSFGLFSQVDESETGAWYMYFYNHQFRDSQFGIQGDFQYRDWQGLGDMEQLLLRSGLTFTPNENRIYQEALIPQKLGSRFYLTHRFRYEQRFVEGQDFRTRYRYNLFLNVPLNRKELSPKAIYVALYNELFINGQQQIGDNRSVEIFDRNRTYLGMGYVLNPQIRFQLGWMNQKTENWGKGQLQFSMHHKF